MIELEKLQSADLKIALQDLEESVIVELENMLLNTLLDKKSIQVHGRFEEVLEFVGRTNYKIRLRRPNKNVWSISFKECHESIRKVLRLGTDLIFAEQSKAADKKYQLNDQIALLLHILPAKEYQMRSFIGNLVEHPSWGVGQVVSINENGNIQVQFKDRSVRLRPDFVKLKIA